MKLLSLFFALAGLGTACAQVPLAGLDPEIMADVAQIRTIDNHAHPPLPPAAGAAAGQNPDRGFDALPVDNMEPQTDPVAWSAANPQLHAAWLALWHLDLEPPLDAVGLQQLAAARHAVQQQQGLRYDDWLLDQAGIATQLANRVSLGPGVAPPRFRWVPYVDALLFPFSAAALARETPDRALFFPLEAKLRDRYLQDSGMKIPPATLEAYLQQVVLPTIRRQHAAGAVAEKFEIAYLRDFAFGNPTSAEADAAYTRAAATEPALADLRTLSDYLFRQIALECGRLGIPVHLHGMAGGGAYFSVAGVNPLLLEPVLDDPAFRHTNFVLLHGGWPYIREIGALLQKPNVYLDISQEALLFPPRTLSGFLREWLEMYPSKVLFGTDGYPYSDAMGWEESTWMAAQNAKRGLALALSGMVADGEITRPRAHALAVGVLNGNAGHLYGF